MGERRPAATLPTIATAAILFFATCRPDARPSIAAPPLVDRAPSLAEQASGVKARLQAVSAADDHVVWTSGLAGHWLRSLDGGETWRGGVVAGGEELQFRDVHAVSATVAFLLAAGPGESSRIYRTDDGGSTWTAQFRNQEPEAFYDCFGFWDSRSGIAFSDSVDGRFPVLRTTDGVHWSPLPAPAALDGEGGFAASGTCVLTAARDLIWIATGAAGPGRVLASSDRGDSWSVAATGIGRGTPSSGLTSLAFWDGSHGLAAGGDIEAPEAETERVVLTHDGGRSWRPAAHPTFPGAVYGAAVVPGAPTRTAVIVGPGGASYTTDGGGTWQSLSTENYWSVTFSSPAAGWMVGPQGRITAVRFAPAPPL